MCNYTALRRSVQEFSITPFEELSFFLTGPRMSLQYRLLKRWNLFYIICHVILTFRWTHICWHLMIVCVSTESTFGYIDIIDHPRSHGRNCQESCTLPTWYIIPQCNWMKYGHLASIPWFNIKWIQLAQQPFRGHTLGHSFLLYETQTKKFKEQLVGHHPLCHN